MPRKPSVVSGSDSSREQHEANVWPREQSALFGDVVKEAVLEGARRDGGDLLFSYAFCRWYSTLDFPLKNVTTTPESSGELHGTIAAARTAQGMSSAHPVPFVPAGVELVSRATYISRKKRNRETCWRQSKALKRVQREAKHKLVAQPEISHEAAEAMLRGQAPRTDEKFPGITMPPETNSNDFGCFWN